MKTIGIMGGTSDGGLGSHLLKLHADRGDKIGVMGRTRPSLRGENIHPHKVDVLNSEQYKYWLNLIELSCPSILYYCIGAGYMGPVSAMSLEHIKRILFINQGAPVELMSVWARVVEKEPDQERTLVLVSSTSGSRVRDNELAYCSAKSGLDMAAECFSKEIDNTAGRVLHVVPGGMKGPFWNQYPEVDTSGFNDPKKVADIVIEAVDTLNEQYRCIKIERGEAL